MKRTIIAPEASIASEQKVEAFESIYEDRETKSKLDLRKRLLVKYENKQEYLYPVEKIAQDKLVILNIKYPGSDDDYPHVQQAAFRFVSKVYPNALGGPLYVDEPRNNVQTDRAWQRHENMVKRKLRHIIVEQDSSYSDLLEQLGEL